jgi:two-component system OmpR family response regulator
MSDTKPTPAINTPYAVVIEDDDNIRELHRQVLTQSGFAPVLAANATDGLEAVRDYDPVVTLVDVQMPGMDGFAAARRIREFSDTYILMVTALADEIDVIEGLSAGADDYIQKPFRPRELRARIDALLRRPRTVSHSLSAPTPPHEPAAAPAPAIPAQPGVPRDFIEPETPEHIDIGTPRSPRIQTMQPRPAVIRAVPPHPAPVAVNLSTPHPSTAAPAAPTEAPVVEATVVEVTEAPPATTPAPAAATGPDTEPTGVGEFIHSGTLALNRKTGDVRVEGRPVELNSGEFALLSTLVESGNRIRSTANLVLTLRDEGYVTTYYINEDDKRAVKAHMSNLMRKLGDTGVTPKWVENVRDVGYRMVVAD